MRSLNRLNITGDIDSNTPKCVLEEICRCNSIKFDVKRDSKEYINKIINKIYKSKIYLISENYETDYDELRLIARFVNPGNVEWKRKDLCEAFLYLEKFRSDELCKREIYTFEIGEQTPEKMESLNACVLYKICKVNGIDTNFNTSIKELAANVKLFFLLQSKYLSKHLAVNCVKNIILDFITFDADINQLVNMLNYIDPKSTNDIIYAITSERDIMEIPTIEDFDFLDSKICNYNNLSCVTDRILVTSKDTPDNHIEAIVMAALYHKIDLTNCSNPLIEFDLLKKTPYFPHDTNLKRRIRSSNIHPESLANPYLNKIFNPNLPENMYSKHDLIHLCFREGLIVEDQNYYSALQTVALNYSFVHGKQVYLYITNDATSFLDEVSDLFYDEVVLYGIRNNREMIAFTYGELLETFSSTQRFINPHDNTLFSKEEIDKLYLLTQLPKFLSEMSEHHTDRLALGEEIQRIKLLMHTNNKQIDKFIQKYQQGDEAQKQLIENFLKCLLDVAMYMRKWDGVSDYPLKSEETVWSQEEQIVVDDRVTQGFIRLDKICSQNQDLGYFMLNMPLMEYHNESKTFITTFDSYEGLTIKDRVKIVRGESETNLNSCIRLSSNRFCATSYYYMILIGFKLPFNIDEVSYIF